MSEDDDEDWFERALRELDEEGPESEAAAEEEHVQDDESRPDDGIEPQAREGSDDEAEPDDEAELDDAVESRSDGDVDVSAERSPNGSGREQEPSESSNSGASSSGSSGSGSFGQDDPFGGGSGGDESFGGGSFGQDDPFGGGGDSGDGNDPFGGGGGNGDSDDPFGGGSFGEGDPFGGSGSAGNVGDDPFGGSRSMDTEAPSGFDEDAAAELDSDIDRTDIGIAGLDEMILGGVPSRSLLSVIGGAGTGKTTFALQFLNEALESGDRGVYITLEQSRESILSTAEEKGWPFREHAEAGRLAVAALDPIEMANSLASIRNDLARLIESFEADRLVLDSVSLLEMMYDHPAKRRSEVFGFTRSLKEAGVTTLLTSEASDETPYSSRYGIVEYLTDAVFVLQYVRGSDFRETRLAVEIQKIRDANHSRETKPYEITNAGISVYRQANIF
ncbi:KaiC domain protein [Halorubrum alkaliphilum]|uniref:KaiC domain protein n=1 Tax=Halorubrum alkaliphilum TaxID=261290 RepID=A0A8T4GB43_9EURY|nr:KaiC domain-containing protein [Halorubrum alkaliphilum]MBP1921047.1 KaiC domain protein [Halorubrum alkaliphilum]